MLRDYQDITSRLGEPYWWDGNGAPRYCVFRPDACGIYDAYVALCLVRCQACGAEFSVAIERERAPLATIVHPTATDHGTFHFGDPPRHDCVGDTMNSDLVQILEFWSRDNPEHRWGRLPEREFAYRTHGSDEGSYEVEE